MDYFELNGLWCYKLRDPFGRYAYLPLDANDISQALELSYRTALRICQGKRKLKKSELLLLQVIKFGLIPDKAFMKGGFFVRDGKLITTKIDGYELSTGELFEYSLLKSRILILQSDLALAHAKIKELTSEPEPTNIINFADFRR